MVEKVKKQMSIDETRTRQLLRTRFQSISSGNIITLELSNKKFKQWRKLMEDDRPTQELIQACVTDTAFRINGDRLRCTICSTDDDIVPLTLEHILMNCSSLEQERMETIWCTENITMLDDKAVAKSNFAPMFIRAAKNKIKHIIWEGRQAFFEENEINNGSS